MSRPSPPSHSKDHREVKPPKGKVLPEIKPWDRRIAKQGDGSATTTYAAVGKALSEWTTFEVNLARLFATLLTGDYSPAIAANLLVFGSVRTYEGRAEMMRTASAACFQVLKRNSSGVDTPARLSAQAIAGWEAQITDLMKSGDQFVARRNDIAHGLVRPMVRPRSERRMYLLYPTQIERKKHSLLSQPLFAYSSKELAYYSAEFDKLAHTATFLYIRMRRVLSEHRREALS
jgi:hypothetical protein